MGTHCVHYAERTLKMATSRHGFKRLGTFLSKKYCVLVGYVTNICDVYIDNVLIHGESDRALLSNARKVLERLRSKKVTANPKNKTSLGLDQVEYVGHLVSSEGVSFTPER